MANSTRPAGLCLGLLIILVITGCGTDKASYVRENQRILDQIPEFPGAEMIRKSSNSYDYPEGEVHPFQRPFLGSKGYTTNLVYNAGDASPREVVDFYMAQLQESWECRLNEIPVIEVTTSRRISTAWQTECTQGEAMVAVVSEPPRVGGDTSFELVVDQRGARD